MSTTTDEFTVARLKETVERFESVVERLGNVAAALAPPAPGPSARPLALVPSEPVADGNDS